MNKDLDINLQRHVFHVLLAEFIDLLRLTALRDNP